MTIFQASPLTPLGYDYAGARKAGLSDATIIRELAGPTPTQGSKAHADFDFHRALAANVSPSAILEELATRPDPGFNIAGARAAGYTDAEIVNDLASQQPKNLLGAIIGPRAGNAVHDALLSVIPGSVQRGAAHMTEGLANTADMMGATGVGGYLHNQVNQSKLAAPQSSDAVRQAWHDGRYLGVIHNLPGAVGEALPQLGGAVAGAAVGGAVGGPVGLATGVGANALLGIATQAGDIAKARARADGRDTPNDEDIAVALGSSGVLGALDRIGLGKAAGGMVANLVKRSVGAEAAGRVATGMGSMVAHGASDAAQSVGQQLAQTAGTAQGTSVNPDDVAAQAIIGGATRATLGAGRAVRDRISGRAALDAKAAQAQRDRATWDTMTSEEQAGTQNTAAAGAALRGVQDNATSAAPVNDQQAARAAIRGLSDRVNGLVAGETGEGGSLSPAEGRTITTALREASRRDGVLTSEHMDAINDLPLAQGTKTALTSALGQIDKLSAADVPQGVPGPLARAGGITGSVLANKFHVIPGAGFIVEPVMRKGGAAIGGALDTILGNGQPRLRVEAERAAAMLEANGIPIPDTAAGLKVAVLRTQKRGCRPGPNDGAGPRQLRPASGILASTGPR